MPARPGFGGGATRWLEVPRPERWSAVPSRAARRTIGLYVLAFGVTLAATFAVHGYAITRNLHHHHWEDSRFFRHTREKIHTIGDCFTRPGAWPGLYRPLTTNCYYLAGSAGWGNRVEVYHLINLAVYLGNGLLLFWIARFLLPDLLALLAVGLWASRLAQWQTLLYTSEFQGLFAMFLSLLAIGCALSTRVGGGADDAARAWPREAWGLLAFAGALVSKESAVVVPAIVSAATWLYAPKAWRRDLAWWAVAAAWALLFTFSLRGLSGTVDTGYAYDFSAHVAGRFVSFLLMFANAAVDPIDHWGVPRHLPEMATLPWVAVPAAVTAIALLGLLASARRLPAGQIGSAARVMALGAVWFLAGTAPFVVLGERLFLRYSLFGNAGLALILVSAPLALVDWGVVRSGAAAAPAATSPTPAPTPP